MNKDASLVHTRLAIVDLSPSGEQPFFSKDGRFAVIYNGEIYNHADLRRKYGLDVGACDGSVLPELWSRLGPAALSELRGMFALCVFDTQERRMWLATDPLGIKPLYVSTSDHGMSFASEVVALADYLGTTEVDPEAHAIFMAWGCLPSDRSGIAGIDRMPPGEIREFDSNGAEVRRANTSLEHWRRGDQTWHSVVETFIDSVNAHLMSDVPLGLMLSAGVDSAAIAWAAAESGNKLDCFTLDLPGGYSESELAAKVAKRFGHSHQVIRAIPDPEGTEARFLRHMDRPTSDGLNVFVTAEAMRKTGLKVMLSGTGGDEVLAGYRHHAWRGLPGFLHKSAAGASTKTLRWAARHENSARAILGKFGDSKSQRILAGLHATARGSMTRNPILRVRNTRVFQPDDPALAIRFPGPRLGDLAPMASTNLLTAAEWAYYLDPMLLADSDIFSMAVGMEARVPMVDIKVVSSVLAVPGRRPGKQDFVHATGDTLLVDLLHRRKTGFLVPVGGTSATTTQPATTLQPRNREVAAAWRSRIWASWLSKANSGR